MGLLEKKDKTSLESSPVRQSAHEIKLIGQTDFCKKYFWRAKYCRTHITQRDWWKACLNDRIYCKMFEITPYDCINSFPTLALTTALHVLHVLLLSLLLFYCLPPCRYLLLWGTKVLRLPTETRIIYWISMGSDSQTIYNTILKENMKN